MMNENNDVFTMEDEPIASVMQNMRKGSKWLSAFLESYRPPLDGERYLTDGEVSELLRVSRRTLQEYRNNPCCPLSFWEGRCFTRKRGCARYWKRTTASRWSDANMKKEMGDTFCGAARFLVLWGMCNQQYPDFPFCMNITYACRFSLARAFPTSHVRNRWVL